MNVGQIQSLMLTWLDDQGAGYFTQANTLVWVNMAHRQVQLQLLQAGQNWYLKPVESYTVNGQADYLWPSDFLQEHRIEVVLSGTGINEVRQPLTPITTNQQDMIGSVSGPPTNYFIKKDRFTLLPVPDTGGQGPGGSYLIRLYYSPMVVDLSQTTDVPDVPEQFMEYVALLAAYNGFIQDDRAPANLVAKIQQYEALLKQMAQDRTTDMARQVVQTQDYDMGSWMW